VIIEGKDKEIEDLKEFIRQLEKENGKLKLEKGQVENKLKEEQDKNKKMNEIIKINTDLSN
jgi:regulator of replication initiation timing